ncbi:MAG: putative capsular polysaccharide synthesis family protein [Gammaproteobacteria bacterium]
MRRDIIRELASKNYQLARLYLNWGYLFSGFRGDDPVVVYQMGKVGSSSIVASLHALKLQRPVYHVHTLISEHIRDRQQKYEKMFKHGAPVDLRRASHLFASQYLCRRIKRGAYGGRWKVVSLVRDPIAMNVSGFFQIIDYYIPDFFSRLAAGRLSIEDAIEIFFKDYDHEKPLIWFDIELKSTFGVEVFATPFSTSSGYEIYRGDNIDALVLRLESMDACAQPAFREFLGIEEFKLVQANVSEGKSYFAAYKAFKEKLVLPESYLDRMYQSKFAQHFYTQEERAAFRAKWSAY